MSDIPLRPDLAHDPTLPPLPFHVTPERYEPQALRRISKKARALPHLPPIRHALATIGVGTTIEHGGLAVTPLVGDDDPACDYLTLDEALSAGLVVIREISPEGSVNELHVFNRAERPLLIVDGEELEGSVQNRVVNLTVLVAARTEASLPVSCAERGRCTGQTFRFTSSSHVQFASGRAQKMSQVSQSLARGHRRQANQVAIWHDIHQKAIRMQAVSDTDAMAAMYERHAEVLESYVEALPHVDRCRGAVFAVHGRLAGMELFDSARTWSRFMAKIVRSYAIDALDEPSDRRPAADVGLDKLLDVVADAGTRSFTTFGDGFDVRIKGESVAGAALVYGSRVLHLAAFAAAPSWLLPKVGT